MSKVEYFKECIECSLDAQGVTLSNEIIAALADDIADAHDSIGQAFYVPENPLAQEVSRLEKELAKERGKTVCPECVGSGRTISYGPHHSANSRCFTCHGEGYK